jgi:hypothetical protein
LSDFGSFLSNFSDFGSFSSNFSDSESFSDNLSVYESFSDDLKNLRRFSDVAVFESSSSNLIQILQIPEKSQLIFKSIKTLDEKQLPSPFKINFFYSNCFSFDFSQLSSAFYEEQHKRLLHFTAPLMLIEFCMNNSSQKTQIPLS